MSYAEIEDVKARAGRLKDAWGDGQPTSDGDIARFIRDATGEVDLALAGHGYTVPQTEQVVTDALRPVVADIALLAALAATWPGGNQPQAVGGLAGQVKARVDGYRAALADGSIDFLIYLREQEQGDSTGAANFWSKERDYSSWLDDLQSGRIVMRGTGIVLRSPIGPEFHKDGRF